jgi:hypothetical protein
MNPLASTPVPAHADSIGHGAREFRQGISSSPLLVFLVRVVALVFLIGFAFWSLCFLWFAERHLPDKRIKSERHTGLSGLSH